MLTDTKYDGHLHILAILASLAPIFLLCLQHPVFFYQFQPGEEGRVNPNSRGTCEPGLASQSTVTDATDWRTQLPLPIPFSWRVWKSKMFSPASLKGKRGCVTCLWPIICKRKKSARNLWESFCSSHKGTGDARPLPFLTTLNMAVTLNIAIF